MSDSDDDVVDHPPSVAQTGKPVPVLGQVRRPHLLREVEVLARTHTAMCVEVLAEIARDKKNPAVARVAAADSLLNRGWGKAPLIVQVDSPVEMMSDEQLALEITSRLQAVVQGNVIEGSAEAVREHQQTLAIAHEVPDDDDPTDI